MALKDTIRRHIVNAIANALGWKPGDAGCESVKDGVHCLKPARHVEESGNEEHRALGGKTWPF